MKSFDILKALSAHKYDKFELVATTDLREFDVHCGKLDKNKWYIFCDQPVLGLADACGLLRRDSKLFYAYIIHE